MAKTSKNLAERILKTYDEMVNRPGGCITLVDLRHRLADVPAADLDRALIEMDDNRAIQLEPDPDRAALTAEARQCAIRLAGEPQHLMRRVIRY